ncbi:GNAT family N-acetyltransferase [Streptomyces boninensis]|uniref:GNAT family N-acetyltransferase n=1 Tax=Streptomyces boninensis TaxID=2039455 RepID=UPI003B2139D7
MTSDTGNQNVLGVRPAQPDDLAQLTALETAADRLFDDVGRGSLPPPAELTELLTARCILVAGRPPVGFARLDIVDGHAHLEQLSVHPDHGRQGIGASLLDAACQWAADQGHTVVTLCTFADVPWNAPFYARHGFRAVPDLQLTPGLQTLRHREAELGLDAMGPRTVMTKTIS